MSVLKAKESVASCGYCGWKMLRCDQISDILIPLLVYKTLALVTVMASGNRGIDSVTQK